MKAKTKFIMILFLIILALNIFSIINKAIAIDEMAYISNGYLFLKKGLFFIDNAPPLIKVLSGIPLLFLNLELPPNYYDLYANNKFIEFGANFLYTANNNPNLITFLGRILPILLTFLLAFFVFKWAKELYGLKAGLFALILYTFSPNILAGSRLAKTDFGITCFMFISIYFLWRYMKEENVKNLVFTAIFFGLAQITKLTGVFLIPIFIFLLYFSFFKGYLKGKATFKKFLRINYVIVFILIIGIIMINIAFVFQGSFTPLGKSLRDDESKYFDKNIFNSNVLSMKIPLIQKASYFYLEKVPVLLPYPYLKTFVGATKFSYSPAAIGGFMNGKLYPKGGNFFYYAQNFLIRTPLPLLMLLILSLIFFKETKSKNELYLLIVPLFVLIYFSMGRSWSGIRYLMPIYPFLFVFVSKIIKIKKLAFVIIGLMILFIISSLSVFPHYSTYFNWAVGGPSQGYRYFSDGSFDMGQDLKLLGDYIEENDISNVKLAYFGEADPNYYNIPHTYLVYHANLEGKDIENCTEQTGIIAISITYLQPTQMLNNSECFSWLREYEPKEKIGNTIFVYST